MLTLPNILTLSRIVAVPLLVLMLWPGGGWLDAVLAFALYCLMGFTDYFDGYVARARGAVSRLGILLGPLDSFAACDRCAYHPCPLFRRVCAARVPRLPACLGAGEPARQVENRLPA